MLDLKKMINTNRAQIEMPTLASYLHEIDAEPEEEIQLPWFRAVKGLHIPEEEVPLSWRKLAEDFHVPEEEILTEAHRIASQAAIFKTHT